MAIIPKPIPALYTVYILRSTVRHASLYIGSTPHPPRRLAQHNGVGGARRTARNSLRPWEMVALVSGFPSMISALKFEWALANPHSSMHIPTSSRISVSVCRKANGLPQRPRQSLKSILSNLYVLLGVPSFARWPLRLHFFAPDVHAAWGVCSAQQEEKEGRIPWRKGLEVVTDFGPSEISDTSTVADVSEGATVGVGEPWGIHALSLAYEGIREYVTKGQGVFEFEREGDCIVCRETLVPGEGLHVLCSNEGCEGVAHLSCWSKHLLVEEAKAESGGSSGVERILPLDGTCPSCGGRVEWGTMMMELTLRTRGQKEVDKLVRVKKKRGPKPKEVDTYG